MKYVAAEFIYDQAIQNTWMLINYFGIVCLDNDASNITKLFNHFFTIRSIPGKKNPL